MSSARDTIDIRWITDTMYVMDGNAAYYIDSTNQMAAKQVILQPFQETATPRNDLQKKYGWQDVTVWIRWKITNTTSRDTVLVMVFNRISFFRMYSRSDEGLHLLKTLPPFYNPETKNERRSVFIHIPAGQTNTFYLAMRNPRKNMYFGFPILGYPAQWINVVQKNLDHYRYQVFTQIFFLAIFFFITIHTLAQYYFNRRKEFLLYAFYSTAVIAFALFKIEEYPYVDVFFSYFPYVHNNGNNIISYLLYLGYYRFVRCFINFKSIAGWFYKVIIITEQILIAAIFADLLMIGLHLFHVKYLLFNVLRCYLLVTGFTGIILLFRSRNRQAYFIAVGSGFLLAGGLISMVLSWVLPKPYPGFDPLIYMQMGIVIELLCFTLGLSYKTSLIEKEKIEAQKQLIYQLEENKQLQDQLTTRLEARVKQQMLEITAHQEALEREKEQQITLEFKKKLTEMELKVLKSQLNPHFYFNTLNNLYGLTITDPKKAPDAILKLSDIMEYVIYDCKSEKVPVLKELKFISSYMELEKLRYEDNSRIQLHIGGKMDNQFISPLLLIQFVENAFKHGMEQNKNDSYLFVDIMVENNHLVYRSVNSTKEKARNLNGVGLANVQKRLNILYPEHHRLIINEHPSEFKVELHLQLA